MTSKSIKCGVQALESGGVIAYPSEGVWGLGCDPYNQEAVEHILQLKGRSQDKGLILVASSLQQILPLLEKLPAELRLILEESCPGPDTWLIPDPDQTIPHWIKGKFVTVAVRVSEHPTVKALCENFAGLIVSTSANPEGLAPAINAAEVEAYFSSTVKNGIASIVEGSLGSLSGPSTIRDLVSGRKLRV